MIENIVQNKLAVGVLGDVLFYSRRSMVPPESKSVSLSWLTALPYLYRKAIGVNRHDFAKTMAFEAFAKCYTLISRGDDSLDQHKDTTFGSLKSDPVNKRLLTEIIDLVHQTPTASPEAKKQFLDEFEHFFEEEYQLHKQYMIQGDLNDLVGIKKYKESTCGLNARMGARMLRLFIPNIDNQTASYAEEFFVSTLMYFQVWDDVGDFLIDRKDGVPNYLMAALHMFPDEEKRLLDEIENGITEVNRLRSFAPQTFKQIDTIAQEYLSTIPKSLSGLEGQIGLVKKALAKRLTEPQ